MQIFLLTKRKKGGREEGKVTADNFLKGAAQNYVSIVV